jgi:hypothetical protein
LIGSHSPPPPSGRLLRSFTIFSDEPPFDFIDDKVEELELDGIFREASDRSCSWCLWTRMTSWSCLGTSPTLRGVVPRQQHVRQWSGSRWWLSEERLTVVAAVWALLQSSTLPVVARHPQLLSGGKRGHNLRSIMPSWVGLPTKTSVDSKSWYKNRLRCIGSGVSSFMSFGVVPFQNVILGML